MAVEAVELAIACQGIKPWEKMGRRSVVLEPGLSVSSFLMIEGPTEHPGQCNVRILGYDLKDPTAAILKMLLRTGYSADERAALLAAHRANGANLELMTWAQQIPVEKPDVTDVLEQLIGWFALATHGSSDNGVWPTVQGLERLNQPLQVVLTARERGSRFSSPIAFLLPDGLSTMDEVRAVFQNDQFIAPESLTELKTEKLKKDTPSSNRETEPFYRNLSLALFVGIILWALFGLRKKGV